MRLLLTALIFVAGLFDLLIGASFLIDPAGQGAGFGLSANTTAGLSALRADFPAFFIVAALCMMWGAWRRNGDLLLVPIMLFGIAFTGRSISLLIDGSYDGFWFPMTVEAGHVILLITAWRLLPHHRVSEIVE